MSILKRKDKIVNYYLILSDDFKINVIVIYEDKSEEKFNLLTSEEDYINFLFFLYKLKRLKENNKKIINQYLTLKSSKLITKENEIFSIVANSECDDEFIKLSIILKNDINEDTVDVFINTLEISISIKGIIEYLFTDVYCYYGEHYKYLERNLRKFLVTLEVPKAIVDSCEGMIISHGDKIPELNDNIVDIPYGHVCLLYMLSYISPYSNECRNTPDRYVSPFKWIKDNYKRFFHLLPKNRRRY